MPDATATASKAKDNASHEPSGEAKPSGDYVLPVVHVSVPSKLIEAGFWGGLAGAVVLGAIDPPLGVLMGAGVVVARHQTAK